MTPASPRNLTRTTEPSIPRPSGKEVDALADNGGRSCSSMSAGRHGANILRFTCMGIFKIPDSRGLGCLGFLENALAWCDAAQWTCRRYRERSVIRLHLKSGDSGGTKSRSNQLGWTSAFALLGKE